ncbi:hypothetical protein E2320_001996, partial [Naja naja]
MLAAAAATGNSSWVPQEEAAAG